jgi:hypothetical protein
MGYGREALIVTTGHALIPSVHVVGGGSPYQVDFTKSYPSKPVIILTSATTQGGGAVNAYASDITTTGFKINISDNGNYVDVHWRAILDRQQPAHGKGNAATSDGA